MGNLYLVFFIVSAILFGLIVWYSYHQNKKQESPPKRKGYIDPLFDQLQQKKKNDQETKPVEKPQQTESQPIKPNVAKQERRREKQGAIKKPTIDKKAKEKKVEKTKTKDKTEDDIEKKTPLVVVNEPDKETDVSNERSTELIAKIINERAVDQTELLALFREHDFKFNRAIKLFALNQMTDQWRDVELEQPSARFTELAVSMQLADRNGAMSSKELNDFQQLALAFSNKYDARFEFSMDLDVALEQGKKLDKLGQRYDSMAVLNVIPKNKDGFRIADVKSCARDLMMSVDSKGILLKAHKTKQASTVLYRLACTNGENHFSVDSSSLTSVQELVFYMIIPRVSTPEKVFLEMVDDAKNLATWLEGKIVDRQGKTMSQRSYAALKRQISEIVRNMKSDGLVPGDNITTKIF